MAIIYARQSLDRHGDVLAVSRQVAACRKFAKEHGWTVDDELIDNDLSATTGKRRPGFEKLLAAKPDRIIVWHIDRLVRMTSDLERVIELGVNVHAVKAGHIDLSNPAGKAVARTITAWATYEGEQKAVRQRAANRQRAEAGNVAWSRRPFGYDHDAEGAVVVVEDEAELIRTAARDVLAGKPIGRVVREWNAAGVTTTPGGAWGTTQLRRLLTNPRLAGRAVYRGEQIGTGAWEPILDAETYTLLCQTLNDAGRRTSYSTARKHLLSGLALCGVCGGTLYASPYGQKGRRYLVYRCRSYCLSRRADRIDDLVQSAAIGLLSRPDALDLLTPDVDLDALRHEATTLRGRRDDLARLLADGLLTPEAVRAQSTKLTERLRQIEDEIAAATADSPATRLAAAPDVGELWARLDLDVRRSVIDTLMTVTLEPVGKGTRFTPESVRVEWKAASAS
jgi:DNA invertase Pin-like site-specific DNA recombinase